MGTIGKSDSQKEDFNQSVSPATKQLIKSRLIHVPTLCTK